MEQSIYIFKLLLIINDGSSEFSYFSCQKGYSCQLISDNWPFESSLAFYMVTTDKYITNISKRKVCFSREYLWLHTRLTCILVLLFLIRTLNIWSVSWTANQTHKQRKKTTLGKNEKKSFSFSFSFFRDHNFHWTVCHRLAVQFVSYPIYQKFHWVLLKLTSQMQNFSWSRFFSSAVLQNISQENVL